MKRINVLMTGAGAPGAPGILECYKKNGEREIRVLGVDIKEKVPTINMLDNFLKIPPASSETFIDEVYKIAVENNIDVIQPLVTRELEIFAQEKKRFEQKGIQVCVSPIENLSIANDKGLLLEKLDALSIDVPRYRKVSSTEEFIKASEELGYPDNIICFKPTKANGSRGFRILDARKDLGELLFNEKPNSTYIDYDIACRTFSKMKDIPELLVMEYMPGEEYSIDMLLDHGKCIYVIPRMRQRMNGGISTACKIVKEKSIMDYCIEIAEKLNLHGNIGIQVRRAVDGKFKILEINPRVQGTIVACAAAGVNLPYYGIKLALGEEIPVVDIKWETEMERYWQETYFDNSGFAYTF